MKKAKSVDEYIKNAPKKIQGRLKTLRKIILSIAPKATERISYAMPYYEYKGRLAYFSYHTKHIGLYVMTPTLENFKEELAGYDTTKATWQLPNDKKLPINLIKKIIKSRVKKNESRN